MNKEDIKTKEDYIDYLLYVLHDKPFPLRLDSFFFEVGPTCGIENFQITLDELSDEGLISKSTKDGGGVPGLPGLRTLDIKYSITLKGIQYLKDKSIICNGKSLSKNNTMENQNKYMFISYCWDNEDHKDKVLSFVNKLRKDGYNADVDRNISQNESAVDFNQMMHQSLTNSEKVIVVLSEKYKTKADNFEGGVGNEYRMMLADIVHNKNKYILVSLSDLKNIEDITPLGFRGRKVLNLSKKEGFNELYSMLSNEKIIELAEVSDKKVKVEKKHIPDFELTTQSLDIVGLNANRGYTAMTSNLYTEIQYKLALKLKNNSSQTVSNYSIEVSYPRNHMSIKDGIIGGDRIIKSYDSNPQIFTKQEKMIALDELIISNKNALVLLKEKIEVKIFTDSDLVEKVFDLSNIMYVIDSFGYEKLLTLDMF